MNASTETINHNISVCISKNSVGTPGTPGTAKNDAGYSCCHSVPAPGTPGTKLNFDNTLTLDTANNPTKAVNDINRFPDDIERPCYRVYDDWCGKDSKMRPGVYYHGMTKGSKHEESAPIDTRLCGVLKVIAIARNKQGREFGQVLEFIDKDRQEKHWNMPSRLLGGRGDELQKELFDAGLDIVYNQRSRIADYVGSQYPKTRLWTASMCGWFDIETFVLPDQVIGDNAKSVMYQCDSSKVLDLYTQSCRIEEWQRHIAQHCVGNPLMLLAVSQAFSGALLDKCSIDGIGVHIFGESSKGKTSGMRAAGSVWGNPKTFNRSWTSTANGLEAAATSVNDGLLCLDEMSKADPDEVSKSLYMLANGIGKQRATVTGSARALNMWRISVLSNGEESIEARLLTGGIVAKPGELVRFLQLPIFGKFGAFDELHGVGSGRAFSELVARNTGKYYGAAGIAYLEKLTRDKRNFSELLDKFVDIFEQQHGTLSPQEGRAARAFGLIALAGELAIEYEVTGWPEGAAMEAALQCFDQWRNYRGNGELEHKQLVDNVRRYIETYGDARFSNIKYDTQLHGERSGYWRETDDDNRQWLFSSAGFKKAIGNMDSQQAARLLISQGVLIRGVDRITTKVRVRGGQDRFYVIQLGSADHD
jgi:putative DNA primase/helicase